MNVYQKKIKKLYEEKVSYQRMYEKSRSECEYLRKSLRKHTSNSNNGTNGQQMVNSHKNTSNHKERKENYFHDNIRTTKETMKVSDSDTFSRK